MRCAICHDETIGRDPVKWGPEFAHRTCVIAFKVGADVEREECANRAAGAIDEELETSEGESLRGHVRAEVMRSNVE